MTNITYFITFSLKLAKCPINSELYYPYYISNCLKHNAFIKISAYNHVVYFYISYSIKNTYLIEISCPISFKHIVRFMETVNSFAKNAVQRLYLIEKK